MSDENREAELKELAWQVAKAIDGNDVDLALAALGMVARVVIEKWPEEERAALRADFVRRIGYREH